MRKRAVLLFAGYPISRRLTWGVALSLCLASCLAAVDQNPSVANDGVPQMLVVDRNPYANVDWTRDLRLKVQLHDHAGVDVAQLSSYDAARYDVVSLMTYSGVASLSKSWKERHWPPEAWLPREFLDSLKSIKLFLPDGEEVGRGHVTSPFMTAYIALWEPAYYPSRQSWHYSTTQQCIDLIRSNGGVPILAHPWFYYDHPGGVTGFAGMEVYSAYIPGAVFQGIIPPQEPDLTTVWDSVLQYNSAIFGIAVNDHYGPYWNGASSDPRIRDSGKTIILAPALSATAIRDRLLEGAAFAVKDFGVTKDKYAYVASIEVTESTISINTDGSVRWIGNGNEVGKGPRLVVGSLPLTTRYVRAEISNDEGSIVFTQAFGLRAVPVVNNQGATPMQ